MGTIALAIKSFNSDERPSVSADSCFLLGLSLFVTVFGGLGIFEEQFWTGSADTHASACADNLNSDISQLDFHHCTPSDMLWRWNRLLKLAAVPVRLSSVPDTHIFAG
jgi:hypothetical protein